MTDTDPTPESPVKLVYLDTETTSLDTDRGEVWEIGYAVDDEQIHAAVVPHRIETATLEALNVGQYFVRGATRNPISYWFELDLRIKLAGATVVGSNPDFDLRMLGRRWNAQPWHYRTLNVSNYAMPAMKLSRRPPSLRDVADFLHIENPAPHTAAGDVHTVRECHRALTEIYGRSDL